MKLETINTVLFQLRLIHLKLQPAPVDNLIGEDCPKEDFAEGAHEGLIFGHLATCQSIIIFKICLHVSR